MPGPGSVACPKPEPRRKSKARKDRKEAAVEKAVRAIVADRDGRCRLESFDPAVRALFGACDGPGEWAHILKRSQSRGQAPEIRHASTSSLMLCARHHRGKPSHEMHDFEIEYKTDDGADGPLRFVRRDGAVYEEGDVDS